MLMFRQFIDKILDQTYQDGEIPSSTNNFLNKFLYLILLSTLLLSGVSLNFAQEESINTMVSEDFMLEFTYPLSWTLLKQDSIPQIYYTYEFEDTDAFMSVMIINPMLSELPTDIHTSIDVANYFAGDTDIETRFIRVGGYEAVRAIFLENDESHVQISAIHYDGWVLNATITAPSDVIPQLEEDMQQSLDSLSLGNRLEENEVVMQASTRDLTPKNLEAYDIQDVSLNETYSSEDNAFSLQYPSSWSDDIQGDVLGFPNRIYWVRFTVAEDVTIMVRVIDIGNPELELGSLENTPQEWLKNLRVLAYNDGVEFLIGDYPAVIHYSGSDGDVRSTLAFALDQTWLVIGEIDGTERESLMEYEEELVAVLASLQFSLERGFVLVGGMKIEMPGHWEFDKITQENGEFYVVELLNIGDPNPSNASLGIAVYDMDAMGLSSIAERSGLEGLVNAIFINPNAGTLSGALETETIKDFDVLRATINLTSNGMFGIYYLFFIDDEWLVMISGIASTEDQLESITPDVITIIEKIDLSGLP